MPRSIPYYGWKPSLPGPKVMEHYQASAGAVPTKIDLSPGFPPVYNQATIGSCVAHAGAALVDYERKRQGLGFISPARLWLYYKAREIEGTLGQDSGCEPATMLKVLATLGAPKEADWGYDVTKYNDVPPDSLTVEAANYRALKYRNPFSDTANLKAGLALGFPFMFGFTVYQQFESDAVAASGIVPMPLLDEEVVGGHGVDAVGYDDSINHPSWPSPGGFLVRNSWGSDWGLDGYFYLSYSFMMAYASDYWSIRLETATA